MLTPSSEGVAAVYAFFMPPCLRGLATLNVSNNLFLLRRAGRATTKAEGN